MFYRLSEDKSIERFVVTIVVTKKIATQCKYAMNIYQFTLYRDNRVHGLVTYFY